MYLVYNIESKILVWFTEFESDAYVSCKYLSLLAECYSGW